VRLCFTGGMGAIWVPWILVVLLMLAVVAIGMWARSNRTRWWRSAEQLVEEGRRKLNDQAEESRRVQAAQRSKYHDELRAHQEALSVANAERDAFRRHTSRWIGWELVSRDAIVELCNELRISGVVATNVAFVPNEERRGKTWVTQIDHVLLTKFGCLVIENKYWRGLVFDGIRPSSVNNAFGTLFPDATLNEPFALRVVQQSSDDDQLDVLVCRGRDSPRSQVRLQAKRLSGLVQSRLGIACWFHTSVFYSHHDAVVYVPESAAGDVRNQTAVSAGKDQLRRTLEDFKRVLPVRERSPVEDVGPILDELGADMIGVGAYQNRWASAIAPVDGR